MSERLNKTLKYIGVAAAIGITQPGFSTQIEKSTRITPITAPDTNATTTATKLPVPEIRPVFIAQSPDKKILLTKNKSNEDIGATAGFAHVQYTPYQDRFQYNETVRRRHYWEKQMGIQPQDQKDKSTPPDQQGSSLCNDPNFKGTDSITIQTRKMLHCKD